MSDSIDAVAANLLGRVAAQNGVNVDSTAAIAMARQLVTAAVDLLDNHTKARAAAAGKAAAGAVSTEVHAESLQRKP